jgi:hypothetical protein
VWTTVSARSASRPFRTGVKVRSVVGTAGPSFTFQTSTGTASASATPTQTCSLSGLSATCETRASAISRLLRSGRD